jgi:cyanophycinase
MAIGGAEDKFQEKHILQVFWQLSGGRRARVAILPTASREEETGAAYREIFAGFGVKSADVVGLFHKTEAEDPQAVSTLDRATGIFMTGGDQNKILAVLHGTEAMAAIHRAHSKGACIGGTSAGASALSNPMIAGGRRGSLPRSGMVKIAPGLGLTSRYLIDQHFNQRERLGRLVYAVLLYPEMIGVGVDEDTAAVFRPGGGIDVIGRGTVTIVNPRSVTMHDPASVPDMSPMAFSNMELATLTHGFHYSTETHSLVLERRVSGQGGERESP